MKVEAAGRRYLNHQNRLVPPNLIIARKKFVATHLEVADKLAGMVAEWAHVYLLSPPLHEEQLQFITEESRGDLLTPEFKSLIRHK